ncbi:MAG: hypothetical protein EF813_10245 [Methanosarcinales archaeon]|nr:MAG: hypothetical protein EF813_10245 [Methanosarcinales archaeon]
MAHKADTAAGAMFGFLAGAGHGTEAWRRWWREIAAGARGLGGLEQWLNAVAFRGSETLL